MKKLLAVLLTAVFALSLTACGGPSVSLDEFFDAIEEGNYTISMNMDFGDDSMSAKLAIDGDLIYVYASMGDEIEKGYIEFTAEGTYSYLLDDEGNWTKELDESGESDEMLSMFNFVTPELKDTLVEKKSGYYVIEMEDEDGSMIEIMSFDLNGKNGVVVSMAGMIEMTYSDLGTTVVTLPTVAAPEVAPEEDTDSAE